MTYRDWFKATCEDFNISDGKLEVIMVNQGLNPDEEVDVFKAKKALCLEFATIIPMYSSVSEGGFSKSYNMEAIKIWYSRMCKSVGVRDVTKPSLKNKSNIW